MLRYGRNVNDLTTRPGLFARLLRAVGLVKVDAKTGKVDHSAGADFVPNIGVRNPYDSRSALSALAAFPWPFACVQAISSDLSSLPIRVYRGKGADAEMLDSHPVLDLLDTPSSRVGGLLFRRQLYTDFVLTGNAFVLLAGQGGVPTSLLRLHPARVRIQPMTDGQPGAYIYDSGNGHNPDEYLHDQILHIRAPSWSDDPSNLWGTGAVQPLHHDLITEKSQAALSARTAATGQPVGILSPKEEGDRWSKQQVTDLRRLYESQMQQGGSNVLILGGQAQFEKLGFTPREMEFSQVRDFVRSSTLAAFDCPPSRVGLPNTNYATAAAQARRFWEGLQGRSSIIDEQLTRLARMFDPELTVRHDFSGVEALQESRTERLNRVQQWAMMGVPLSEAAAFEGFDDLPFTPEDDIEAEAPGDDTGEDTAPVDDAGDEDVPEGEGGEPLAATALNGAQIASLLSILGSVAAGAITFDAAMALIGVSFPTIPPDEAARILAGAQALPDEAETDERIARAKYDEIDFSVPDGVKEELRKGLNWHEEGHSGDGLTPATVSWARRMAGGEDISPEKVVKMRAWLARHESDKSGEGYSPGDPGFPSAGRVAWALWGGDPAVAWSEKLVGQMERADEDGDDKAIERVLRGMIDTIRHRPPLTGGAAWIATASADDVDHVWRAFIDEVHDPAEKKIERVMRDYLQGHAARIAKRVPQVLAQRAVGDDSIVFKIEGDWLSELVDEYAEGVALSKAVKDTLTEIYQDAIGSAFDTMPGYIVDDFPYDPERIDRIVDKHLGELIVDVPGGTRQGVKTVVTNGLAEGATIAEIQAGIMSSTSISSPMRALRIARTEATKSVNAGGVAAWETQAEAAGVELVLTWRAQPNAREAHKRLNGKERGPDGVWTVGNNKATAPGSFEGPNSAELNINCRCFYTPKVIR